MTGPRGAVETLRRAGTLPATANVKADRPDAPVARAGAWRRQLLARPAPASDGETAGLVAPACVAGRVPARRRVSAALRGVAMLVYLVEPAAAAYTASEIGATSAARSRQIA